MKTGDVFVLVSSLGSVRAFSDSVAAVAACEEQVKRLDEMSALARGYGRIAPPWHRDIVDGFWSFWRSGANWIGVKQIPVEM